MSSQHTPGPWIWTDGETPIDIATYQPVADYYLHVQLRNVQGVTIIHAGNGEYDPIHGATPAERIANARLIKAAPDLLQELRNIANANTDTWDDPGDFEAWAKSRARAAIAHAEGRTPCE